jgi:hypothetical protein
MPRSTTLQMSLIVGRATSTAVSASIFTLYIFNLEQTFRFAWTTFGQD